jgi:hypothetical protein
VSEARRDQPRAPGAIPEELVDRFFDRELDEGSRERFFGMLRADLGRCAEVAKTQRIVSMLREPVEAPDLTDQILARVRQRRGFLPERLRRMVKAGRLAVAACLLIGVLGFALGRRYFPGFFRFTPEPQPVSRVIASGQNEAAAMNLNPRVLLSTPPVLDGATLRRLTGLSPGKTSVVMLPRPGSERRVVVYGGAGPDVRFVVENGVCVDRLTSRALPRLDSDSPLAVVEEWVRILRAESCEPVPPAPAAPGPRGPARAGELRR